MPSNDGAAAAVPAPVSSSAPSSPPKKSSGSSRKPSTESAQVPPTVEIITSSKPVNEAEAANLERFKAKLSAAGLWHGAQEGKEASHPDMTLLRFLRARKGSLDGAFTQFKDTEEWRAKHHVDSKFEELDYRRTVALKDVYPQWCGRIDKLGIPIYVHQLARLDSSRMKPIEALSSDERLDVEIVLHEEQLRVHAPYCGPDVVTSTSIIDVGETTLSDFWRLRKHFQWSTNMSSQYYPETLGVILVVNAPFYWAKAWSFISGWLDKGTQEKVHILARGDSLERWIEPANLPKHYGGQLDWEPGQEPVWPEGKGEPNGWYGQTVERAKKGVNGDLPKGPAAQINGHA